MSWWVDGGYISTYGRELEQPVTSARIGDGSLVVLIMLYCINYVHTYINMKLYVRNHPSGAPGGVG